MIISGPKTKLDQRADSGNLSVQRQATWGMSGLKEPWGGGDHPWLDTRNHAKYVSQHNSKRDSCMKHQILIRRKPRTLVMAATLCTTLLAGCLDDDTFDTGSTSAGSGGSTTTTASSFSPSPQVRTDCPSACLNVDVATTRGIPSSCLAVCPEVQTASQCVAAGGAYDVYVKNGRAGADAGTLSQLYTQYQQQASLTRQVVDQIGCR